MRTLTWVFVGFLTLAVALVATPARAFQVEWQTEPARGGVARVAGYVRNDSLRSAVNLHLRVDRLAPDGGIAATYRRQMAGVINPGDRAYFEVGVPERDATYRVTVEAFDWFRCGD